MTNDLLFWFMYVQQSAKEAGWRGDWTVWWLINTLSASYITALIPQLNQSQWSTTTTAQQMKKWVVFVWEGAERQDVKTRHHKSAARGRCFNWWENSLLKHLRCPIMKLVFVPLVSPINFNRPLSEVLLNCILFSFTRGKTWRTKTDWLVWKVHVWLTFLSSLSFSMGTIWDCIRVGLRTLKIFHSAILNTLCDFALDFFFFCSMLKIVEDTCIIKCYLKVHSCSTDYSISPSSAVLPTAPTERWSLWFSSVHLCGSLCRTIRWQTGI